MNTTMKMAAADLRERVTAVAAEVGYDFAAWTESAAAVVEFERPAPAHDLMVALYRRGFHDVTQPQRITNDCWRVTVR